MSDVGGVLRSAADLLEPEGAWTHGAAARSAGGAVVFYRDAIACRWCASGAVLVSAVEPEMREMALTHLRRYLEVDSIPQWNDAQTGPGPVLAALRGAAEKAS